MFEVHTQFGFQSINTFAKQREQQKVFCKVRHEAMIILPSSAVML